MPVDPIIKYLGIVESAFSKLESGYIERYEEEILTPEHVNLRIRVRFPKGYILEWNEAVTAGKGHVDHLAYRYHFQDRDNKLIFRYDNTPHFPQLETFPHHKHLPDSVTPVNRPSALPDAPKHYRRRLSSACPVKLCVAETRQGISPGTSVLCLPRLPS